MLRGGSQPGDVVVVLGDLGLFWAGVLFVKNKLQMNDAEKSILLRNVLTPIPKIKIGWEVASRHLLTSCIDNSDGLYPSLVQLSETNDVQLCVGFDAIKFGEEINSVCTKLGVDPVRLCLGWGDWQLFGTAKKGAVEELREVALSLETAFHVIGEVRSGKGVKLEHGGATLDMPPLDSQRFASDSWFSSGIDAYIKSLLTMRITHE
jgi:thiamine-monophosphate kinase